MIAEIKTIWSPDVDSLETYVPEDGEPFAVFIQLLIGEKGGRGEESLNLTVCSGSWLTQKAETKGPQSGLHHLIVDEWNWAAIRDYCHNKVEGYDEESWGEIGNKLHRFGHWEFADYQPYAPPE